MQYSLETHPALPATELDEYCYAEMFEGCESLKYVPVLPATNLSDSCYELMFFGCTSLKVSDTQTGSYQYEWRIPASGNGNEGDDWNYGMLYITGETFTDDPEVDTVYYVEYQPSELPRPNQRFRRGLPLSQTTCGTSCFGYSIGRGVKSVEHSSHFAKLISEDRVQLVLRASTGTFANTCDLAFTGKDLRISPIKYLAPILYDADKSVQYFLPDLKVHRL